VLSKPNKLPVKRQMKYVFSGLEGESEMVSPMRLKGESWETLSKPFPWMADRKTLKQLGYTEGTPKTELVEFAGMTMTCTVTEYTREALADGRTNGSRLRIWRSKAVDLPPQTVVLPSGSILVEPSVVRIATVPDERNTYHLDFQLTALKQPFKIGDREVQVAVFKSTEVTESIQGKHTIAQERYVSAQVPSGVAKMVTENRPTDGNLSLASTTAVEFGVWKAEAAAPK
jgi:hypothetical protein